MKVVGCLLFLLGSLSLVRSHGLFDKGSHVDELTDSNFDEKIQNNKGVSIVMFFAPWCGHCKNFAPEYIKAAKTLDGVAHVAAVDCTQQSAVCNKMEIKGYPTVKIFGSDKSKPEDYQGPRSSKGVVKEMKSRVAKLGGQAPPEEPEEAEKPSFDGDVVVLSEDNFESFIKGSDKPVLVKFFAPWCGHCKSMAGDYKAAAKELKKVAVLAEVDATVATSLAGKFGVKGFPTLRYFTIKDGKYSDSEYDGGRGTQDIVGWINEKTGSNIGKAVFSEIINQETFTDNCLAKSVCVLAFIPTVEDTSEVERKKLVKMVKDISESDIASNWGWNWVEGGSQMELEKALRVDELNYPFLITIFPNRKIFSIMPKDMSEQTIRDYIKDFRTKKQKITQVLPKLPTLKEVKQVQTDEL